MDLFLNLVASGLVIGAVYGMVAMSFVIIFKTTGILNFAQGEVMMLVAYTSWSLSTSLALPFVLLIVVSLSLAAVIGIVLERLFIRPMLGQPTFAIVMVTIGLAIVLRSITVMIWGPSADSFEAPVSGGLIQIGPVFLFSEQVFTLALFFAITIAVYFFFRYSRIGISMRATAQDETAALLMGVDVRRISAFAWGLSAIISGLAGISFSMVFARSPDMWFLGLQSFPATILGGLDALLGSGFAGLIIGVIGELSEGYIGQGVMCAVLSLAVGLPSLRLKGLYLAITTIAFSFIITHFLLFAENVTHGPYGVRVEDLYFLGLDLKSNAQLYYLVLGVLVLVTVGTLNIMRSRVGRAFTAVRDHDIAARVMGISLTRYKLIAFMVSSFIVGIAGGLMAFQFRFINVDIFSFLLSVEALAMIIVGGLGSVGGAILGAVFIVLLPEVTREALELLPQHLTNYLSIYIFEIRGLLTGLAIIIMLRVEAHGLIGLWYKIKRYWVHWPLSV